MPDENERRFLIPGRIKVGFVNRDGTYNGKLAYVIYYDNKGVLRKEKSWDGWRNHKIPPVEYDNVPTEGFVLNKKVGGVHGSYSSYNVRQEYCRVFDPRGFEFEITIPNLLAILTDCDCFKGKGLDGKFVYSWSGTSLVLLPAHSEDYKRSAEFTTMQAVTVKAKELIAGATYVTKKLEKLVYLGKFDWHYLAGTGGHYYIYGSTDLTKHTAGVEKRYIFWDGKEMKALTGLSSISSVLNTEPTPELADLIDKYYKSPRGSRAVALEIKKRKRYEHAAWAYDDNGKFRVCKDCYDYPRSSNVKQLYNFASEGYVAIKDGILWMHRDPVVSVKNPEFTGEPYRYGYGRSETTPKVPWVTDRDTQLYVVFESGKSWKFDASEISRDR